MGRPECSRPDPRLFRYGQRMANACNSAEQLKHVSVERNLTDVNAGRAPQNLQREQQPPELMTRSQGPGEREPISSSSRSLMSSPSILSLFTANPLGLDHPEWDLPSAFQDAPNPENAADYNQDFGFSGEPFSLLQNTTSSSDALAAAAAREARAIEDFLATGRINKCRTLGNGLSFNTVTKLSSGGNYAEWASSFRAAARKEGVWYLITGHCKKPSEPSVDCAPEQRQIYYEDLLHWANKNDLALGGLEGSLEADVRLTLDNEGFDDARELWLALEKMFKPPSKVDLFQLLARVETVKLDDFNGNIAKFANEIRRIRQDITKSVPAAEALPAWYFTFAFIRGLGDRFLPLVHDLLTNSDDSQGLLACSFESAVLQALEVDQVQKEIERYGAPGV
ncbi:hypothetical protein Asppvi_007422 [Aspergillus pseudoviridinutans]|uniref:Uncharacterized protein n=1 Tax=Aspergillus pseudoviridinutans TaxID=1517512 RepID=A0A9P3BG77_9EURO|nr:uncharacterized protein Asppvi_007422 [Aspergillus pseudoviridinutans]GIJ88498.1 hypothetical protein Asppvi_007422 [Aspergillus pseudoviridinutans]